MKVKNPDTTRLAENVLLHEEDPFSHEMGDVIEVPLLLSACQVSALEEAAHHRGLTTGEMVRQLLEDFIAGPNKKAPKISYELPGF